MVSRDETDTHSGSCSFCGLATIQLFRGQSATICPGCVDRAEDLFKRRLVPYLVRFDLAWGGHESEGECFLELTGRDLADVVEALVEAGVVAHLNCLSTDRRLRAGADFSPDPERVVTDGRIHESLTALDEQAKVQIAIRLGEHLATRLVDFLGLASFHGGYTVQNRPKDAASR